MKKEKINWHKEFLIYMDAIAASSEFKDMPDKFKQDGCIKWICTPKSETGKKRQKWWNEQRDRLGITPQKGDMAETARKLHPFGEKECQVCGKVLSLQYVYPNKNLLKKIHNIPFLGVGFTQVDHIEEIVKIIYRELKSPGLVKLKKIFEVPDKVGTTVEDVSKFIIKEAKKLGLGQKRLGPGVMSDVPDRFDGFHTFNRCCRDKKDKGRSQANLAHYGEDRRVFEYWSDGDWKAADRLMKLFNKHDLSPDHEGPISLGFCHRPSFDPTTLKENISKRNRLGLKDVKNLINDEANGEDVVSRHSEKIWNKIKNEIKTEEQANELGKIMGKNLSNVLDLFYEIKKRGFGEFLVKNFLNPQYAHYDITFEGFDPKTGKYEKMSRKKGDKKQYANNETRYIKNSLRGLDIYKNKDNRRLKKWKNDTLETQKEELYELLKKKQYKNALEKLKAIFDTHAKLGLEEYKKNTK